MSPFNVKYICSIFKGKMKSEESDMCADSMLCKNIYAEACNTHTCSVEPQLSEYSGRHTIRSDN